MTGFPLINRQHLAVLGLAAVFFVIAYLLLYQKPCNVGQSLRISQLGSDTNGTGDEITFLLTNQGPRQVLPEYLIVQAKTASGWSDVSQNRPADPTAIPAGQFRLFPIKRPSGAQAWRLQVTYRYFLRGPDLWTSQIGVALRSRHSGELLAPNIVGREPIVSAKTYAAASSETSN